MSSKGVKELVQGLRLLHMDGLGVHLTVLGQPAKDYEASDSEMQHFIDSITNESWIDVVGSVSPSEVSMYLSECDVVALPSTYSSECQPLSIIQAMIAGRHLLLSRTNALITTAGTYPAIYTDRDPVSIAEALRPYADRPMSIPKISSSEIAFATRRFSVERFDEEMLALLS